MRSLPKTILEAETVFLDCISRIEDLDLRGRLEGIAETIVASSDEFDRRASTAALHEILQSIGVDGIVTKDEMNDVYTRMVSGPGRKHYDAIKQSAPNSKCPLCAHRNVKTLDHVLPKSRFSKLAVTPLNLIPACSDCNKAKRSRLPTTASEAPLHPYYDDIEDIPWLVAHLTQSDPVVTVFSVQLPDGTEGVLADRIANHFDSLELAELYKIEAAEELTGIRQELTNLLNSGGIRTVREHLIERASSMENVHLNWWRTAAYKAWAGNDWFCAGGFAGTG